MFRGFEPSSPFLYCPVCLQSYLPNNFKILKFHSLAKLACGVIIRRIYCKYTFTLAPQKTILTVLNDKWFDYFQPLKRTNNANHPK